MLACLADSTVRGLPILIPCHHFRPCHMFQNAYLYLPVDHVQRLSVVVNNKRAPQIIEVLAGLVALDNGFGAARS
jgi:hypothetical protein